MKLQITALSRRIILVIKKMVEEFRFHSFHYVSNFSHDQIILKIDPQ